MAELAIEYTSVEFGVEHAKVAQRASRQPGAVVGGDLDVEV